MDPNRALISHYSRTSHGSTILEPMNTTPSDYELVIVGTPIWNASVSADEVGRADWGAKLRAFTSVPKSSSLSERIPTGGSLRTVPV